MWEGREDGGVDWFWGNLESLDAALRWEVEKYIGRWIG